MDNEFVFHLIDLYKNEPTLWDTKNVNYFNKHLREDKWRIISEQINIPVKDIKKKITSLLGSFRREKSRERKSKMTGSGANDVYKSQWFAYNEFRFLADKDIVNDAIDSMDVSTDQTPDNIGGSLEGIGDVSTGTDPSEGGDNNYLETNAFQKLKNVKNRKRRAGAKSDEMLEEAYSMLKQTSTISTILTNPHLSFGNHIANELQKYDSKTLPYVKKAILDVIFRADIGEFSPTSNLPAPPTPVPSEPTPVPSEPTPVPSEPASAPIHSWELFSPNFNIEEEIIIVDHQEVIE